MLGYVATRDAERAQALRDWRRYAGAIPGPFETWLAHRSLPTLALRLERGCDNALAIAAAARGPRRRGAVCAIPGLPGDPGHEVARRQMRGFGWSSRSTSARRSAPSASSPPPGWSPTPPASAASTRPPSGAPAGAATPSGGLHPALGRLRGHGRPAGRRRAGARRVTLLVTGGTGYLGGELLRQAGARCRAPVGSSCSDPARRRGAAFEAAAALRPVIHTAYRQDEPRGEHASGAASVADAAAAVGARLVHISTDLVFDGTKGAPYTEDDDAEPARRLRPLEARGRAARARRCIPGALVVRTSLIVRPRATRAPGAGGARGGARGARCRVLRGRVALARSSSRDLAAALLELAGLELSGMLHVAGAEAVSRYELACLIAAAHGAADGAPAARDHRRVRPRAGRRTASSTRAAPGADR